MQPGIKAYVELVRASGATYQEIYAARLHILQRKEQLRLVLLLKLPRGVDACNARV